MKNYVPAGALMIWDLIAVFQFVLRKVFGIFLKVPLLREILLLLSYMVKMVFALALLPFFIFINSISDNGCATVIVATK